IEEVLVCAINQVLCEKRDFLAVLQGNVEAVLLQKNDQALADIDERLEELQIQLVKLASSNVDYGAVGDEIYRLREEKQRLLIESANRDEQKNRIDDMGAFLREQRVDIAQYDEQLVRRLVEKVTVFGDRFSIEFKSGIMVDVKD
ncbi:recombinase family protein, partial [Eubacteriales bacterium OttesenSCG-928-N13]|nr:recombinase family protein [Eubacteriales bacterium OttesenSCG-928-N13]